jgi:hypothetical protein
MNTRSAREYSMLAPAQLLRNWREQRPSNQGDLDSGVTGDIGGVCYTGVGLSCNSIFVPLYVIVIRLLFKWYTLYNPVHSD